VNVAELVRPDAAVLDVLTHALVGDARARGGLDGGDGLCHKRLPRNDRQNPQGADIPADNLSRN